MWLNLNFSTIISDQLCRKNKKETFVVYLYFYPEGPCLLTSIRPKWFLSLLHSCHAGTYSFAFVDWVYYFVVHINFHVLKIISIIFWYLGRQKRSLNYSDFCSFTKGIRFPLLLGLIFISIIQQLILPLCVFYLYSITLLKFLIYEFKPFFGQ